MMPQTVPNSPTKGPAEPTVASTSRRRSSRSISRVMVTSITLSIRCLQAGEGPRLALEAALPFAHRRDEQRRHRMRGLGRKRAIKLFQRLSGPEGLLETVHGALGAREQQEFVDRDRPDPDRAGQQADHHGLHDPMRLQEQAQDRKIGCDRQSRLRYVGWVHGMSLPVSRAHVIGGPTNIARHAGPKPENLRRRPLDGRGTQIRLSRRRRRPPPADRRNPRETWPN